MRILLRPVAASLLACAGAALGQNFIVENRGGGGSVPGTEAAGIQWQ